MARSLRELEDFIGSVGKKEVLIYFGSAEIGLRTAKKFGLPSWSVDNSPALWGGSFGPLRDIRNPESLRAIASRAKVVVCSASESEIRQQLAELGVPKENIVLSPYARSVAPAEKLNKLKLKVLVASGGPSSESTSSGGGLYLLSIDGGSVVQEKIFHSSSHGIVEHGSGNLIVSSDSGLVQLQLEDKSVAPFSSLPSGLRPHGITVNGSTGDIVVVGNGNDSLLTFSEDGALAKTQPVLRGRKKSGTPVHHINDIAYSNGALYLSMFSFTGSWQSGVYDGGIYALDSESLESLGPTVSGANMPHSVTFRDGELWFCDSLPGVLTKGNKEFELSYPTFARGLDFSDDIAIVGASRNRNPRDHLLESGTQIREVNSGFFVTLMDSGLSRFIALDGLIPEVHALKILSRG